MVQVSLFNKIKLFRKYKKIVDSCKEQLSTQFNTRVDRSYRIYTVLNIPQEIIGEAYSLRKADIDKISETFTREWTLELSKFLESKELTELYKVYEIRKVDKYSYLLVVGYSLFESNRYYDNLYYKVFPSSALILLSLLILLLI